MGYRLHAAVIDVNRYGIYVDTIANRNSAPTILLQTVYRIDGKVAIRRFAKLSH
ncbi:hypothetical protein FEAC_09530 [Ferrimicrobium acidiphilum DSM 19497]|uniref:Uncharacterized protein n=1 Tax=Ferrimicrobium acidiphilum DSM 19497 TaxID=1121877 RepID=A0A0D8FVX2_9ACTN|nr:hypothetical protein FEAC_09530 [Ferrimicrobium acidiphilum DSM 19497]